MWTIGSVRWISLFVASALWAIGCPSSQAQPRSTNAIPFVGAGSAWVSAYNCSYGDATSWAITALGQDGVLLTVNRSPSSSDPVFTAIYRYPNGTFVYFDPVAVFSSTNVDSNFVYSVDYDDLAGTILFLAYNLSVANANLELCYATGLLIDFVQGSGKSVCYNYSIPGLLSGYMRGKLVRNQACIAGYVAVQESMLVAVHYNVLVMLLNDGVPLLQNESIFFQPMTTYLTVFSQVNELDVVLDPTQFVVAFAGAATEAFNDMVFIRVPYSLPDWNLLLNPTYIVQASKRSVLGPPLFPSLCDSIGQVRFGLMNSTGIAAFTCLPPSSFGYVAYALPFNPELAEQYQQMQGTVAANDNLAVIFTPSSADAVFQNSNYELVVAVFERGSWLASNLMYGVGQNLTSVVSNTNSYFLAWLGISPESPVELAVSCMGNEIKTGFVYLPCPGCSIRGLSIAENCDSSQGAYIALGNQTHLTVYFPPLQMTGAAVQTKPWPHVATVLFAGLVVALSR